MSFDYAVHLFGHLALSEEAHLHWFFNKNSAAFFVNPLRVYRPAKILLEVELNDLARFSIQRTLMAECKVNIHHFWLGLEACSQSNGCKHVLFVIIWHFGVVLNDILTLSLDFKEQSSDACMGMH